MPMLAALRVGPILVLSLLLIGGAFAQNGTPTPPADAAGRNATPSVPSMPSMPTDAASILGLGSKLNGLDGPGISPWHIKATYQKFDTKGKLSASGTYEEFWFSDKSYKRIYTSSTFSQTDYASERGETEVRMYLTAPIPSQLGVLNAQLKNENLAVGAAHLECVTLKPNHVLPMNSAYCFEQDRPMLRLVLSPDALSQTVYNSVVEFQGHFIARDVRVTYQSKVALGIHIDEIESLPAGAAADLNPPSDAAGPVLAKVVPEETMTSLLLAQVPPIYPQNAKEMHVEGTVILHIVVGKDGAVKNADAISGPDALRRTAIDSVRQWMYRPFEFLGDPTEVETNVRIILLSADLSQALPEVE